MAPIQGPLMVPQAIRIVKFAVAQAKSFIRTKAPTANQTSSSLNSARPYTQKSATTHPTALLQPSKTSHHSQVHHGSRTYATTPNPTGKASGPKYNRSSFPTSRTSRAIARNGTAPFASTLRPNLTGGTLPRSAGGYSLGGAGRARQFGHTAGCQAQVVQNVSAGIRAFFINGSKARFDGSDPVTGEKTWRAVTETQNRVYEKWAAIPRTPRGTSIDFKLSPTITALLPTFSESVASSTGATANETSLNAAGVLNALSSDFARALHDFALITHDLSKLSAFGDLPLSLIHTSTSGPILRVRFPGCDAEAVSALCDEVDIRRGVIVEDPSWAEDREVEMALLFPFAPAEKPEELDMQDYFAESRQALPMKKGKEQRESVLWRGNSRSHMSRASSSLDLSTADGLADEQQDHFTPASPSLLSESDGQSSLSLSEIYYYDDHTPSVLHSPTTLPSPQMRAAASGHVDGTAAGFHADAPAEAEYEGVEGIYRFLQQIDDARRR